MSTENKDTTDYRAFARDLMKLCKKHGVKLRAHDDGYVAIGPSEAKKVGDYPFSAIWASPVEVIIGTESEEGHFRMTKNDQNS